MKTKQDIFEIIKKYLEETHCVENAKMDDRFSNLGLDSLDFLLFEMWAGKEENILPKGFKLEDDNEMFINYTDTTIKNFVEYVYNKQ